MKKKLTNNITLKIMSVLVGFLVWLIVVNVDNPIVTTSFTLPLSNIEVVNEAYIDSIGLMCMPDDSQSQIRVHITGDRKTVRKLTASDIRAVADLQQAVNLDTDPVMVPITVTCDGITASNIEVTPTNLTVHLREKLTQEFVVTVSSGDSSPGKGYEIGSLTANPEKIKITGPSSLINKIGSVTATINVEGITADETVDSELRFFDKNGDVLSESQLNYLNVTRTVSVSAKLWKVRSNVKINVGYSGTPAEGYRVDSITTIPDVLSLAGSDDMLRELEENGNVIEIPADTLSIDGCNSDVEEKINITEFLPTGTKLTSGSSEDVWIQVSILPEDSKSYNLPTKNIEVENVEEDLQVTFDTDKIEIRIQENGASLDELNEEEIKASIDLNGKKEGSYEIPVNIELPDGYALVDDVVTEVKISAVSSLIPDEE
jgi:YbbR domain-containing protein